MALDCYNKALVLEKKLDEKDAIATLQNDIGLVYYLQGDYASALENYGKALDLSRKIGDAEGVGSYLINVGSAYVRMEKYDKGRMYLDSGLNMMKRMGVKSEVSEAYINRSVLDSKTGDFKQALQDYKLYVVYNDSLINEANTKKSVQSEMNFEFEQKQAAQKAEQDKKDAISAQERKKQVVIRNIFIGGFAIMLALAFFIFRGYRQKQHANTIITQQKAVVEEKQKEILDSIHYAQRIQRALLASDALLSKHLPEYFVLYKPKDIVSGDFYWATASLPSKGGLNTVGSESSPLGSGGAFYLAVCDSTGHGVPGAFMSLLNISFLNEAITEKNISQPNEVFNHARKRLIENISQEGQQDGMDGVIIKITASPPSKGGIEENFRYETADPILYGRLKGFVKEHRSVPTEAENVFLQLVRGKSIEGYKFRGQHIIGQYIVDFVCLSSNLVIEIDGLIHQLPENKVSDEERTHFLNKMGFKVLRFTNEEVIGSSEKVIDNVLIALKSVAAVIPPFGVGLCLTPQLIMNLWLSVIKK